MGWWHHHAWHQEKIWNAWAADILATALRMSSTHPEIGGLSGSDLDTCATCFANEYINAQVT